MKQNAVNKDSVDRVQATKKDVLIQVSYNSEDARKKDANKGPEQSGSDK